MRGAGFQIRKSHGPLSMSTKSLTRQALNACSIGFSMDSHKANTDEASRALMSDPGPPAHAKTHFLETAAPYFADAYHLARWLTGSRTDAEDVVQEASIRAFRG